MTTAKFYGRALMAAAAVFALLTVSLWAPVLEKAHGVWEWYDAR